MSLLPPSVIPNSLWREGVLHLPRTLADSFRSRLAALGLLDAATNGSEKGGAIGGASDAETLEHFTHLFGVSAGRIQYVTLNQMESSARFRMRF